MRKWIVTFTGVFLLLLALDLYPGLRGGSGWRWPYATPEDWFPVLVLALLLIIYCAGALFLLRRGVRAAVVLLWVILFGTILGVSVVAVRGDPAFTLLVRTLSPVQTGASLVAVNTLADEGVNSALSRWPEIMHEALDANIIHFSTRPPGQPLIHYMAAQLLESIPALTDPLDALLRPYQCSNLQAMRYTRAELGSVFWVGMLMPLWAALAAVPVFMAGRSLLNDKRAALRVTLWWPLMPTVLLFAPSWNTLYPALCVAVFALLLAGLRRAQGREFVVFNLLAGVVMSLTTFLNFAVLPILLFFGLFTLGYWWTQQRERGWRWPVMVGLWFGLGLISLWVVYGLTSGITPIDIARVTFGQHGELVERRYLDWLILHPYDTLLFVGWPVAALFFWRVYMVLRHRQTGVVDVLTAAFFLTFLLVDLSGVVQGENARILSFYAPFLLLAVGGWLVERPPGWERPLLVAQAATVLVMAAVLPVIALDLNPQPEGPRGDVYTLDWLDLLPVDVLYRDRAGAFQLDSYRFVADLGAQAITLETIWYGAERPARPYRFEIVAHAENNTDGAITSETHTWYAQNGNYLPTCWRDGEVIHDTIIIKLPTVSEPVVWDLSLRLVDERFNTVLPARLNNGTVSDVVHLGPVNYP